MEAILDRLDSVPFLLPVAIMLIRIVDVSLDTVRVIMLFRGRKITAACLGFFEVSIWLIAITAIVSRVNNWLNIVFYGLGFAAGNIVGMFIEGKMAVGQQVVRFISSEEGEKISRILRSKGFGVTEVVASGLAGPVGLGLAIAPRKKVPSLIEVIQEADPKAVVTVEDVRHTNISQYYEPVRKFELFKYFKGK